MLDKLTFATGGSPLRGLANARNSRSKRVSSYDINGGNADAKEIMPGETLTLAEIDGAGCVNHIWFTIWHDDIMFMRQLVLRMYWDGEETPSVECPVGDFFGVGHGLANHYVGLAFNMITNIKTCPLETAMNCFLPMPFAKGAKITMTNESEFKTRSMYFYIDYEEVDEIGEDALRFHAIWNREKDTNGPGGDKECSLVNLDGKDNYVLLDAEGRGHYVGCNVSIHSLEPGWPGEGDDMIFIDGETWPPSLHGTGTEDYFCAAWGFPAGEYAGPYHGITYIEDPVHATGKMTVYRHHIEDPVVFSKSIRVTMEHRHGNAGRDDWASVAYWYQAEPHKPFPQMLSMEERLPRLDAEQQEFYDLSKELTLVQKRIEKGNKLSKDEKKWMQDTWTESMVAYRARESSKALEIMKEIKAKFDVWVVEAEE